MKMPAGSGRSGFESMRAQIRLEGRLGGGRQCVIVGVAYEVLKLRDTFIVKEDCVGFVDL